jgi:ubiquinone/menaquinone biosynthesis C-methylase UbiE
MKHPPVEGRLAFYRMALKMRLRAWKSPPTSLIGKLGLKPGANVLDFGCGPGHFALAAARAVKPNGRVYAVDRHPSAVSFVKRKAFWRRLNNVVAIQSENLAEVPRNAMDAVLLFNVLHEMSEPQKLLAEVCDVLTPQGSLFVLDRHLDDLETTTLLTEQALFRLAKKDNPIYRFARTSETGVQA